MDKTFSLKMYFLCYFIYSSILSVSTYKKVQFIISKFYLHWNFMHFKIFHDEKTFNKRTFILHFDSMKHYFILHKLISYSSAVNWMCLLCNYQISYVLFFMKYTSEFFPHHLSYICKKKLLFHKMKIQENYYNETWN